MIPLSRRLAFRVLTPIIVFALGFGIATIWLAHVAVSEFVEQQLTTDLRWRANSAFQIIDANFDELQRTGKSGDDIAVRHRKVNTLMAIEDFARANELRITVRDTVAARTVEIGVDVAGDADVAPDPLVWLFGGERRQYTHAFRFEPWRWEVALQQDNRAYLGLLNRLSWGAGIGAVVFIGCIAGFMVYLTALTGRPIRKIIGELAQNRPPTYRGIAEFEYLGHSISNMMDAIREQSELLEATFANIGEGLCVFDSERRGLAWNAKFLELYALPPGASDTDGRISAALKEALGPAVSLPLDAATAGRSLERVQPDGRIIEIRIYPMGDGRYVSTHDDITERRRAQQELTRHRDHLEELVKERTIELARSNADLEQFAYVASHDLQEPLRMVGSYTQLLAQRYQDQLDNDAREFIGYAVEGAKWMQVLINDLLAYSRVGTKAQPFKPTDVNVLLATARKNLQIAIGESGAQITHDPLPTLMGDATQLTQLLQNLLGNAIKFRGERAPQIHVGAEAQDGCWRLSVRDNGIGIARQHFERIFTLFQRLHSRSAYPGTGIGLAVCKKIVERHGGQMWVESEPGSGATFYFTIPRAAETATGV
jgi:signal transduction histidine kinase